MSHIVGSEYIVSGMAVAGAGYAAPALARGAQVRADVARDDLARYDRSVGSPPEHVMNGADQARGRAPIQWAIARDTQLASILHLARSPLLIAGGTLAAVGAAMAVLSTAMPGAD